MKHALVVLAALILGMSTAASADPDPALSGSLRSLLGARQWLNTQPLRPEDLRGKVILVNFWTYSCINSLRALPYVREWAKKYRDRGLVVIGVQTPKFAFEKDVANVSKALVALDVDYPVAIDNDYGIWRAFDNEAWPGFYFVGADGQVRHHVFGEGGYDESERLIQQLLSAANGAPSPARSRRSRAKVRRLRRMRAICARMRPTSAMTRPGTSFLPAAPMKMLPASIAPYRHCAAHHGALEQVMKKRGSGRMPPGEFQPNPKTRSVLDGFLPPLLSDLRARCDETLGPPDPGGSSRRAPVNLSSAA